MKATIIVLGIFIVLLLIVLYYYYNKYMYNKKQRYYWMNRISMMNREIKDNPLSLRK